MRTLLVLAGGFGTRLRSVVSEVPKPLAPVAGLPFLHHLIGSWLEEGIGSMVFLLHHQAARIEQFLRDEQADGQLHGVEVLTITEPAPLGTGGAVALAMRQLSLEGPLLIANADTWLSSGVAATAAAPAPAIGVVHVPDTSRYGAVQISDERIDAFAEKASTAGPGWINAGLYHLDAGLFRDWNGQAFSLERQLFPSLLPARELRAVPLHTDFIDIGIPDDYARFCRWIESGKTGVL